MSLTTRLNIDAIEDGSIPLVKLEEEVYTKSEVESLIAGSGGSDSPFVEGEGANSAVLKNSGLQATNNNEVAIGKYNKSDENTIFSVGCGSDDETTKNAFDIKRETYEDSEYIVSPGYRTTITSERNEEFEEYEYTTAENSNVIVSSDNVHISSTHTNDDYIYGYHFENTSKVDVKTGSVSIVSQESNPMDGEFHSSINAAAWGGIDISTSSSGISNGISISVGEEYDYLSSKINMPGDGAIDIHSSTLAYSHFGDYEYTIINDNKFGYDGITLESCDEFIDESGIPKHSTLNIHPETGLSFTSNGNKLLSVGDSTCTNSNLSNDAYVQIYDDGQSRFAGMAHFDGDIHLCKRGSDEGGAIYFGDAIDDGNGHSNAYIKESDDDILDIYGSTGISIGSNQFVDIKGPDSIDLEANDTINLSGSTHIVKEDTNISDINGDTVYNQIHATGNGVVLGSYTGNYDGTDDSNPPSGSVLQMSGLTAALSTLDISEDGSYATGSQMGLAGSTIAMMSVPEAGKIRQVGCEENIVIQAIDQSGDQIDSYSSIIVSPTQCTVGSMGETYVTSVDNLRLESDNTVKIKGTALSVDIEYPDDMDDLGSTSINLDYADMKIHQDTFDYANMEVIQDVCSNRDIRFGNSIRAIIDDTNIDTVNGITVNTYKMYITGEEAERTELNITPDKGVSLTTGYNREAEYSKTNFSIDDRSMTFQLQSEVNTNKDNEYIQYSDNTFTVNSNGAFFNNAKLASEQYVKNYVHSSIATVTDINDMFNDIFPGFNFGETGGNSGNESDGEYYPDSM